MVAIDVLWAPASLDLVPDVLDEWTLLIRGAMRRRRSSIKDKWKVTPDGSKRMRAAIVVRVSLWALFPLSILWALISLTVGMSYGASLFQLDDPWPTILWLLVLALPIWIFQTLLSAGDDWRRLAFTLIATLAFVTFFVLTQVK